MTARPWRRLLPMPLGHVAYANADDDAAAVRRRHVVVGTSLTGAALLGAGLSTRPGSTEFYALTMAVAGTWTAGGLLSGPLHLGWIQMRDRSVRRPVLTPLATGAAAFLAFYGTAAACRRVPPLDRAITRVLRFADEGDSRLVLMTTLANGVAEELFFRGALFAALPPERAVVGSTAVYALTTVPTRNPALVLAAGAMGVLFGLQRQATGGFQASAITHATWSTLMLRYLPGLFTSELSDRPAASGRPGRTDSTRTSAEGRGSAEEGPRRRSRRRPGPRDRW